MDPSKFNQGPGLMLFKDKFKSKKALPKKEVALQDTKRTEEPDLESANANQNESQDELQRMIGAAPTDCETPGGQTELNPIAPVELSIENIFPQTIEQSVLESTQTRDLEDSLLAESQAHGGLIDWLLWMTYPIWWVAFHAFCCCLFVRAAPKDAEARLGNESDSSHGVMAKLKKHLKKRKNKDDFKTIHAMVELLKNSPSAISLLEKVRVNPQLNRLQTHKGKKHHTQKRNDLEFYLPQIVAHFLRDDLTDVQENEAKTLIIRACKLNLFFAHRIWFNLKASLINQSNQNQVLKIVQILSELEVLAFTNQEKLYIANSESLIKTIQKANLTQLMDQECMDILQGENQPAKLQKKKDEQAKKLIMNLFNKTRPQRKREDSNIALSLLDKDRVEKRDIESVGLLEAQEQELETAGVDKILDKFNFVFAPYKRAVVNKQPMVKPSSI